MLQRAAQRLAERGFHVFPCLPRDKRPATAHGCKDATRDVIAIQAWWQKNPNYNIAIATGGVSGIFVLDVDGAEAALSRLEAEHGALPQTVEAITPRGRHLYLKHPGTAVGNTASKIAEGIDSRGDGGYVLAPPSVHPSGRRYCWSIDSASFFADAPQWVLSKITQPNESATTPSEWRDITADVIDEGARNVTATRLSGYLLRRYVDPQVVYELMLCWNFQRCRPPLPVQEIERVVTSIAQKEMRRRAIHG